MVLSTSLAVATEKKRMSKKLKELIVDVSGLPMSEKEEQA
jgi:hypothetical protein